MEPLPADLPEGWYTSVGDEKEYRTLELNRELPKGHLLFGKKVEVVAHREGTDDILCRHHDEAHRFTVIHLSWIGKTEINAQHPWVEVDGTWNDFLDYEGRWSRR